MASRDDLGALEADLKAASAAYEAALKALRHRCLMRAAGIARQQAHVQACFTALLRAELALDRARRTGVQ